MTEEFGCGRLCKHGCSDWSCSFGVSLVVMDWTSAVYYNFLQVILVVFLGVFNDNSRLTTTIEFQIRIAELELKELDVV